MMYMRKQMTFRMILSFMKMVSGSEVQDVLLVVQLKPGGAQQASSRHLGCRVAPSASGKDSKTDQAHRCSVLHCPLLSAMGFTTIARFIREYAQSTFTGLSKSQIWRSISWLQMRRSRPGDAMHGAPRLSCAVHSSHSMTARPQHFHRSVCYS
jgi:hypothetical protein